MLQGSGCRGLNGCLNELLINTWHPKLFIDIFLMFPFRKFSSKILIFEFLVSRVVLAVRGWFWPTWDCLAVRTGHFPRTDGTSPDSPWSVSIRSSHQYVWVGFSWTDGPVRTVLVRPDSTDGWSDQHISTYGAFFTYWWDQSGQSMGRWAKSFHSGRISSIRSAHQYIWVGFSWTDGPVRTVLVRPDSTDGMHDHPSVKIFPWFFMIWSRSM